MKKLLFVFSMLAILIFASMSTFALEGDGTEETPFVITDQWELELVTDFPDYHFVLGNDIVLEGTWTPLCKQTSSGNFRGVFDGAGYTISNLITDGSEGGLFYDNGGTIKNLNIVIAEEGMTGSGAIANYNYGTILNCVVNGNIMGNYEYVGGICAYNKKEINQTKFIGNVENNYTSWMYTGGICGYNGDDTYNTFSLITNCAVFGEVNGGYRVGGICGHNFDYITNCYFIGNLAGSVLGGISAQNSGYHNGSTSGRPYRAHIGNCYTVATFDGSTVYGISYHGSGTYSACYYDKTVSNLTDTSDGTPKSTAAMKMKQTYTNDWDFDNIWGIDKNINNGYPYLLWEYPDADDEGNPYKINEITMKDLSGNVLEEIPEESFYVEVSMTKNDDSKNADSLVIAVYDENGVFMDLRYVSAIYYRNQTLTFGTGIRKYDKKIGNIKCFVWDSVFGMKPLSNSKSLK